jgi:hypothetical protein
VLWWLSTARLACVLAGLGLAATRLGLVAHELFGHGGTAVACGGTVTDVELFWFAGGWIKYDLPPLSLAQSLAITLGGIGIELVIAFVLWLALARREGLGPRLVRGCALAIALHAMWYLAVGTYHGFGDGALLRYAAGDGRYIISIAAGACVVALAYAGTRAVFGVLVASIPVRRVAGVLVAALLAGGLQVGLAAAEMSTRRDSTYVAIMKPERTRRVEQELDRWDREQRARGLAPDEAARRARADALAKQHRELPFAYILGALALAAMVAGAFLARPSAIATIPPRFVLMTSTAGVFSVALVIAIDAAFA